MSEKKNNISIIPALSNNSHELFHSNLWQWLLRIDKKFVKCFFGNCNVNHNLEIDREPENLDLRIIDKDAKKQYIIENKLKSIPNDDQLNNYKEKQDKKESFESKYLLVYLIENNAVKAKGWDSIDYIKLTKRIMKVLGREKSRNKIVKKYYNFLEEYCKYIIEEFGKIKKSKYIKSKNYYFGKDDIDETHIHWGLKVIYQKMKAEKFKIELDKIINPNHYNKKFKNKKYCLMSILGYNHGKPCFTYRVQSTKWGEKREELGKHTAVEIQLEGNQYRHMVILIKKGKDSGKKVDDKKRKDYYKKAQSVLEGMDFLNSFNHDDKVLTYNKNNKKKKEFGSYDSGKTTIAIYKYRNIVNGANAADVAEYIKKDINGILKFVNKKKIKSFLLN